MTNDPHAFGSLVFTDAQMQSRLPEDIYRALKKTMQLGTHLELEVAESVAKALKDWAIEKGATHFTHWFQPMTGITAEKHDSFLAPTKEGRMILEFSGRELLRGEPDASSFPAGGLRVTSAARGYTVWDITSYPFIKDGTLCIPAVFCSYHGEALDKKTPLLRSMEALNRQALRIMRLLGNTTVQRVITTVGSEQEYFLIDKELYLKRPDLVLTGRTLFGARPPKGHELHDHYLTSLKPRVSAFMRELEAELWKLGVPAKTKHNEVAPAQHELAPIFSIVNIACDHNQLTMELMKNIAAKHGLACLLHERPFAGINGSGKHINWSLATDTGINLLDPGERPYENIQFLLFLTAVIKAVDEYLELLRASAASAGNDLRLGANEAPPPIVSIFLGEELTEILTAWETGAPYRSERPRLMEVGASVLPHIPKDTADRNRTSPFAFTGNKFEFRMLGSAFSIAEPNIVLNTAVAEVLREFADHLERASDVESELSSLIRQTIRQHKRIIFNGNNYSAGWVQEATRRGLAILKTTVDALPAWVAPKSIALFTRHQVLTEPEIRSRYQIYLENYCKTLQIEALTMADLVKKEIVPACIDYQNELIHLLKSKKTCGEFECGLEKRFLGQIASLSAALLNKLDLLEKTLAEGSSENDALAEARFYRDQVCGAMSELRLVIDELERLVAKKHWRLPTYAEMLFSVN